jgi:hypothetical protein
MNLDKPHKIYIDMGRLLKDSFRLLSSFKMSRRKHSNLRILNYFLNLNLSQIQFIILIYLKTQEN